jgi:hypothetical protein
VVIALKPGCSVTGLQPEALAAWIILAPIFAEHAIPLYITSARDGSHHPGSLHGLGLALDIRSSTKYGCPLGVDEAILRDGKEALGPQYDFILEDVGDPNVHFHVEFDPKG